MPEQAIWLRKIARWAPFLYGFLVACMGLDVYVGFSRHADFAVIPGAVSTLTLMVGFFVASIVARPWLLRRAEQIEEAIRADQAD